MNQENKKEKKKKKSGLRLFFKILLGIFLFLILLLLFIRSPWGQNIITSQLISYVSGKTNTTIEVERVFITFGGDIHIEGLYLEDKKGDTLLFSKELEADIPLMPLIRGTKFSVENLKWSGVRANVYRKDSLSGFNYAFLLEVFQPADTAATVAADTSATSPMIIELGDMDLKEIMLDYSDQVTGVRASLNLGQLQVDMQEFSLNQMRFEVGSAALQNSYLEFVQTRPAQPPSDSIAAPLPFFTIDDMSISNVEAHYRSTSQGLQADLDIQDFSMQLAAADLPKKKIGIENLRLGDSKIAIQQHNQPQKEETSPGESAPFHWPEWRVNVDQVIMENNAFSYSQQPSESPVGPLDPDHLSFEKVLFRARDLALGSQEAQAKIKAFSFVESSGLQLKEGQFNFQVTDQELRLSDLLLQLEDNHLQGDLRVGYSSLKDFMENPQQARVHLNLPRIELDFQEILRFQPALGQNEYLQTLSRKKIVGSLLADGHLDAIRLQQANFSWGGDSRISAEGRIYNATTPQKLSFSLPTLEVQTGREDLAVFLQEQISGLNLPKNLALSGSFSGKPEDITMDFRLKATTGLIKVQGRYQSAPQIAFDLQVSGDSLQLGQILENPALGRTSFKMAANGEGASIGELDGVVESQISEFTYNGYVFRGIGLQAEIEEGQGFANINYKDKHLNLLVESFVELDSVAPHLALHMNLIGADLQALGLSARPVNTAMNLEASFKGNLEEYDVTASVNNGIFVADNQSYLLGDLDMLAHVRPDTTSLNLRNRTLDLHLRSNGSPGELVAALNRHYKTYFTKQAASDTVRDPVNLEFRAQVIPSPILNEVFLPRLKELDTLEASVNFAESDQRLAADISLPYLHYWGAEIDSLRFRVDSDKEGLQFDFQMNAMNYGPLAVPSTFLEGKLVNERLNMEFTSVHQDSTLVHVLSEITRQEDILNLHIDPESLILNSRRWEIEPENGIRLGEKSISFENFRLSRNNQVLEATSSMNQVTQEHVGILFDNFNLAALFSYLNPEEVVASGKMGGSLIIEDPFGSSGIIADLEIQNFGVSDVPLGKLTLEAESLGGNSYDFDLAIKDGNADLDLEGSYLAREKTAELNMQLDLNEIKMEVLQGFSQGEVSEAEGSFSGSFSLRGTLAEPIYQGNLHFQNAGFEVTALNANFVLPDEHLRVTNEGLYLESFRIQDADGNDLVLNGSILTNTLLNPSFDLSFQTEDFKALNATEEDNELLYGTAVIDASGSLTGDLKLPQLEIDLAVKESTDVTYVIPEANLEMQQREGVVIFTNRENPDRILTQRTEEEELFSFTGLAMNSFISVNKGAAITVVLDEDTGDHFRATGQGDLLYNMYPNGRTTMSGRYEISGGHYEMNLYELVSRRFELMEGSSVVWAGDPMDADLNITAVYEVEASASALMAPLVTGSDLEVRNRFRQELPFLVYLRIGGEISQPEISFGLDMPEGEQGALGGQVYGRVQQINQQEGELNKQVFSLLVLNRFFPNSGSPGTRGGTVSFARDNLNEALSDQLNLFSDQLLGETGLNLNFGLDSYTDYQGVAPEERTQLEISAQKAFWDERLIVSVGSEVNLQGGSEMEESPLLGNVSLEYLLTENGRFRLRAFRRRTFENVIDGQLIVSGLALIFTQEFNKFQELWNQIVQEEKKNKEP